jgi:hypothetical protein
MKITKKRTSLTASTKIAAYAFAALPLFFTSGIANAEPYVPWPGVGGPGSGLGVQPGLGFGAPGIGFGGPGSGLGVQPGLGFGAPGPGILPRPCGGPIRELVHPVRCW